LAAVSVSEAASGINPDTRASSRAVQSALPACWEEAWGQPSRFLTKQVSALREQIETLALGIPTLDRSEDLGSLVGSAALRSAALHRWYYYKEGFAPELPHIIADELGTGGGVVLDPFAGVGTSLLALRSRGDCSSVIGIEYSPFAHFVATAKLSAHLLDPTRLRVHAEALTGFKRDGRKLRIPALSSFADPRIFDRSDLYDLLAARDAIVTAPALSNDERSFFLLGLAAIVEDTSGAMKDGRALRIRNGRRRRPNALTPTEDARDGDGVRVMLHNQWLAMIEDLETSPTAEISAEAQVVRGDARTLANLESSDSVIADGSVGLAVFSPPYLNCIDYTEVYKLELWLLGMVQDQSGFRRLREGTLRSHPSVRFPQRQTPFIGRADVFAVVEAISSFLEERLPRAPVGRMVLHYFQDMHEVLTRLAHVLEPGAAMACVVANSTFSRRARVGDALSEDWRVPVLTDVLLARLAEAAGFESLEIWSARDLRPRNVSTGSARESVVVGRMGGSQ
jgi:hypothetical protein